MEVVRTVPDLRARLAAAARPVALVPTMGALHEGHLSLVRRALSEAVTVVVSIFVNPLQFGPGEDFERYPRDLDHDLGLLRDAGVAAVFAPQPQELTPEGRVTTVHVARLTERFEGAVRPGHFDGVATIVTKLLGVCQPDLAVFGEKDFQQLAVIRALVRDLDLPVAIIGCPTVREADGLALSSRNAYLSAAERESARAVSRSLFAARDKWDGNVDSARDVLRRTLGGAPGVVVDYAEVVDPETLEPLEGVVGGPAQALVAARVGRTRLIDNIRLEPTGSDAPGA